MHSLLTDTTVRDTAPLAEPHQWALFLDIDGTLIDVAPTPDAAHVPPGLTATLKAVAKGLGGAVALSTGRRVSAADRLFAPLQLVTSGVHGTELRSAQRGEVTMLAPIVPPELVQRVNKAAARIARGILVEQKGAGLAVHYRSAPEAHLPLRLELGHIIGLWSDFELRSGRKVLEIVPRGYSKGTSLAWIMKLPPFQGRVPVMIGDDDGDEPALAAARRYGGIGLKVAGEHFCSTAADFGSATEVRAWLVRLAERLDPARADRPAAKRPAPPASNGHAARNR
jgi:trehalose 6-phosphate phosphatase